jgi:16S rRNA U516 pseudouridylate synthase RsuA-like enzyme
MIRLNKLIAAAGIASRRQADLLIQQGQVRVNGKTVTGLGMQVDPQSDLITVGSQVIRREQAVCYLILHKPQGYLTTVRDPFGRPTVMDLLPQLDSRVYPVGRLDYDTSGLLFFTNDGNAIINITIREGRKRQVKRMLQAIDHPVTQLQRIAMGPLILGDLPAGHWRFPSRPELAALLQLKAQQKQNQ